MPVDRFALDFPAFVAEATADPAVVGLVLKGSQAHEGMTTRHSDHDLYVVLADDAASGLAALDGYRSPGLDLVVTTLERFRRPADWERYAVARIVATGEVAAQQRLFAQVEAAARAAGHGAVLDAWGEDLVLMRPGALSAEP